MITYNHEPYIADAIEGVLMQKCDFPIELIIGEDCSTDKTIQICKEYSLKYPEIKLLSSEANIGMMPNFTKTLQSCTGKYIALCEGDDYWTDPYKLQKQVDFLDANEDYGLVYTDASIYYQESNTFKKTFSSYYEKILISGNIFHNLLLNNCIQTLTVLVRGKVIMEAIENLKDTFNIFKMGDYPLWLEIARLSKIKYLNDITAVYRVSSNSASCYNDIEKRYDFIQSSFDIQFYFCKKYNLIDIHEKIQTNYNRFLCNKAFDLRIKIIDDNVIQSFVPISIRDRIIKFSFISDFTNLLVRFLFRTVSIYKIIKKKTINFYLLKVFPYRREIQIKIKNVFKIF